MTRDDDQYQTHQAIAGRYPTAPARAPGVVLGLNMYRSYDTTVLGTR